MDDALDEMPWLSPPAALIFIHSGDRGEAIQIDGIHADYRDIAAARRVSKAVWLGEEAGWSGGGRYAVVVDALTHLLRITDLPVMGRRKPGGPLETISRAELSRLSLQGCNAVLSGTNRVVSWDLVICGTSLARILRDHERSTLRSRERTTPTALRPTYVSSVSGLALEISPPMTGPAVCVDAAAACPASEGVDVVQDENSAEPREKRIPAIRAAIKRGDQPGVNIAWGLFVDQIIRVCGAVPGQRGFGQRQIQRLVQEERTRQI